MGRSADSHRSSLTTGERTPTRPKASDRITLGSHSNSAFQPITSSCKIVPHGQPPSPAESPGKSFQPITMSCKIVSGKMWPFSQGLLSSIFMIYIVTLLKSQSLMSPLLVGFLYFCTLWLWWSVFSRGFYLKYSLCQEGAVLFRVTQLCFPHMLFIEVNFFF